MAADLNKPVTTDQYTQILADIRDMQAALAKMNHSATLNLPPGVIQWSEANSRFEKWTGSAWVALMPDASTTQKGLTQLSASTTSTSTTLAATASAVKSVKDSLNSLNFTNIAGTAAANQVPNIGSLNGSLTDTQLGRAAQQAGHVRAGNMQLVNGADRTDSIFQINSSLSATGAFESIGKTGSGKDNIWSAMDALPANARVLIVNLRVILRSSSLAAPFLYLHVASDDVATPDLADSVSIYRLEYEPHMTSQDMTYEALCFIPMSSAQAFKMAYYMRDATITYLQMFYRGFITD